MEKISLTECVGFEWDIGNQDKSLLKHNVSQGECEQVFFNESLLLYPDDKHSAREKRWYLLGRTDYERKLFIAFTIRNKLIRIISARDMSRKERKVYEQIETHT